MVLNIIFWLLVGAATAYFARQRGRDPIIWFVIGIFLGLLGLLLLFFLPAYSEDQSNGSKEPSLLMPDDQGTAAPAPVAAQDHSYLVKDWFYLDAEPKQQGPVSFDFLKQVWNEGKIGLGTFVWCEGMENWKKIDELEPLKEGLQKVEGFDGM